VATHPVTGTHCSRHGLTDERQLERLEASAASRRWRTDPDVSATTNLSIVEATPADASRFGEVAARRNVLPTEFAPGLTYEIRNYVLNISP